jgi:hypothetical protein
MIDPADAARGQALLDKLNALTLETGLALYACGCCSSISVKRLGENDGSFADELGFDEDRPGGYYFDGGFDEDDNPLRLYADGWYRNTAEPFSPAVWERRSC